MNQHLPCFLMPNRTGSYSRHMELIASSPTSYMSLHTLQGCRPFMIWDRSGSRAWFPSLVPLLEVCKYWMTCISQPNPNLTPTGWKKGAAAGRVHSTHIPTSQPLRKSVIMHLVGTKETVLQCNATSQVRSANQQTYTRTYTGTPISFRSFLTIGKHAPHPYTVYVRRFRTGQLKHLCTRPCEVSSLSRLGHRRVPR